jgi:hypothetical protein
MKSTDYLLFHITFPLSGQLNVYNINKSKKPTSMQKNLLLLIAFFTITFGSRAQVVTTVSGVTVCSGATSVDIPVTVNSFTAVGSVSLKFSYVTTELSSPTVIYTDPGITAWGNFIANTGTAGIIIISAYDPDVTPPIPGLTLANGTTLFTLRFTIGTIPSSAALTFVENIQGTSCEYGGVGPNYTPFTDTPTATYYIPGSVTVVADPTLDQPANATVCKGGSKTLTTLAHNGTGTFSYQWSYSSTSGGTYTAVANGTPAGITYTGGTTASLTITGDGSETVADKFYKCTLSSATPSFGGCDATTSAVTLSTVADPTLDQPANMSICKGGSTTLTTLAHNGTGTYNYQWSYSSTAGGTYTAVANGTPAGITYSGGTTVSLTITGDGSETVTDKFYKCALSTNTPTGAGCDATTTAVTLTTVADPTLDQPANASICKGGSATLTTLARNGTGTYNYQWTYSSASGGTYTAIANGTPSGITYSGGSTASLTITGNGTEAAADKYYKCVLSTNTPAGAGCDATTTAVTLTTVADPSISVHPVSPAAVCQGTSLSPLTVTASNGTPSLTYQWYSNTTNSNTGGTSLGSGNGAQTNSYTPPTSSGGTLYYYCVVSASGSGCGDATSNTATVTVNSRKAISGTFNYYNISTDILLTGADITVQLYNSTDLGHETLIGSDVTDAAGYFQITNLCPDCNYDIVATSTHTTGGAVNTTDAAQTNYYGTNPYLIQKVKFHAGDVGTSGTLSDLTIQATDAGRIQQNFVYGTAFDNTWTFWKTDDPISTSSTTESYPSVTLVAGSDLNTNMYGLCTGDFNRSFNPNSAKSASATLDMVYTGNRLVGSNEQLDLPVRMVKASTIGAISLILEIPADLVEVQDVLVGDAIGQLDWSVKGGELRIGWNSALPLNLKAGDGLLTLKLKTTSAFTSGNSIKLTLASSPLNELADASYDVIGDAVLGVDVIDASATGIDEDNISPVITINNYPNPFSHNTMIVYSLPVEGKVTLDIYNILGKMVKAVVNETEQAGNHMVNFDTNGLPPGVYTATLRLRSSDDEFVRTIKMICNK